MLSSASDTARLATPRGRTLQIIIHKGSQEIGGTCIQLSQDDTSILLDLGLPLREGSKPVDVSILKPDAVFVSHSHQDHYGLIVDLDPKIPIYMSELGKRLIDAPRVFRGLPLLENDFHEFQPWVPEAIGPFKITPYLMDHSAPNSFAFLVEAGGQRLFYSGDLRAHGRKGVLFERLIKNPPSDIDVLLMEGTMLERTCSDFPTESSVEDEIEKTIRGQRNISFIICSGQNIDRIVSAFRACKKTNKTLVVDVYGAWILEQMKLVSERVPNMFWDEVKVIVSKDQYEQYEIVKMNPTFFGDFQGEIFDPEHRVEWKDIHTSPADYVQTSRLSGARFIEPYLEEKPVNVIYSQWLGYLDKDNAQYGANLLNRLRDDPRVNFVYAHTTGHALLEDLRRLTNALEPKILIPVHTDYPEEYCRYFDNALTLIDGQEFTIP
jgi:ribonuclease J